MQSNEVRIPKGEFDFSPTAQPCQYFKSSFAKSLTFCSNQTKSLDLEINFNLHEFDNVTEIKVTSPPSLDFQTQTSKGIAGAIKAARSLLFPLDNRNTNSEPTKSGDATDEDINGNSNASKRVCKESEEDDDKTPLVEQPQTSIWNSVNNNRQQHTNTESVTIIQTAMSPSTPTPATFKSLSTFEPSAPPKLAAPSITTPSTTGNCKSKTSTYIATITHSNNGGTSGNHVSIGGNGNGSSDSEIIRLRKECQSLIEENRRLMRLAANNGDDEVVTPIVASKSTLANQVEAMVLQTKVDTLTWQLKQVDSSRKMYRAVMEEVSRFLERCIYSLDSMQNTNQGNIGRSKSVVQVSKHIDSDSTDVGTDSSYGSHRARSSTNLVDAPHLKKRCHADSAATLSNSFYNNFVDFTWRRSPKRSAIQSSSQPDTDPDKLTQEAFRLFRTVQNLLHTQEPILHAIDPTKYDPTEIFDRKTSSRDSRLSMRSGTDDSMHSGSSGSKNETTDEDNTDRPSPVLPIPSPPVLSHPITASSSSASSTSGITGGGGGDMATQTMADRIKEGHHHHLIDDESGFSSMNSFQEIGLPLVNSTMRSPGSSAASTSSESTEMENTTTIENGKERTVVATINQREKLGLPQVSHRRWDSTPVTRLQLSTESTSQVLWV